MPMSGFGDVLLWTLDGDALVDGTESIESFLADVPEDDLHNPAVRVKISGGNLSSPIYIDNYVEDEDEDTHIKCLDEGSGYFGVWVGEVGGRYGAHLNQSEVPSELGQEVLFAIEVGLMTWDDDEYTSGIFTVLAESDPYTYEQILAHTTARQDISPPKGDWKPMFYYTHPPVPEPSTALLTMIGLGLIGLMRKKRRTPYES